MEKQMEVILLSQHPEFTDQCAELLNKQWKRSTSARVQSLQKSVTELPDSLVLIEKSDSQSQVIGHGRLTRVLEDPLGCWIGSVIIREDRRNKGLGKYLMQKTEEYAKALHFSTVYLNTQDQQGFYEHLGYIYCNPVSSISFATDKILFRQGLVANILKDENKNSSKQTETKNQPNVESSLQPTNAVLCPLPPPPPPMNLNRLNNQIKTNLGQFWMKKKL